MATHSTVDVLAGRHVGDAPAGTVVFLIGMRVNQLLKPRAWVPVARAATAMLAELGAHPELGMLGVRSYLSGRTILMVQYWKDAASLDHYASSRDNRHLPAWRDFNRRMRNNPTVGIFHETYVIGKQESIYVNMPAGFGLGGATTLASPARLGQRAAHRLDPSVPDTPTVDPS